MIKRLISGKLIADPISVQSANGNARCRITVACPVQGGKEGETRTGLDVVATHVLAPYIIKQKRNQPSAEDMSGRPPKDAQDRFLGLNPGWEDGFNDELSF